MRSNLYTNMNKVNARQQFIKWMSQNEPGFVAIANKRLQISRRNRGQNLEGIGDSIGSFFKELVSTVKDIAPTVAQAAAQKKIIDVQIKRAEQGLSPLNTEQLAPTIRISPVVTAESEAALTRIALDSTKTGIQKLMPVIAMGVGGVVLIMLLRSRKK